MRTHPDVRRLVAFRSHGATRLLLYCHAAMEDVEGAVEAGQREMAVGMAHKLVQFSLSIRGLATEGELSWSPEQASYDPFAGVPDAEVEAALALAAAGMNAQGAAVATWVADLRGHVQETERQLGYVKPLPYLRSGVGMIKSFKLARMWSPHLARLELPDLLPGDWTKRGE